MGVSMNNNTVKIHEVFSSYVQVLVISYASYGHEMHLGNFCQISVAMCRESNLRRIQTTCVMNLRDQIGSSDIWKLSLVSSISISYL